MSEFKHKGGLTHPTPSPGLVSIIIPVFNRENLVSMSIESALQQTYDHIEIICIDDGSSDNSYKLLKDYAINYPRRVFSFRNRRKKGVSGCRNTALQLANGEFIAFLDSDDRYKSFHIERSVSALRRNPDIDWIFSDFERWKMEHLFEPSAFISNKKNMDKFDTIFTNGIYRRCRNNLLLQHIRYEVIPGLHTSVIRRNAIDGLLFEENLDMFEDWKFRFDAIRRGINIGYLDSIHHEYHIHDNNLCSMPLHDSAKNAKRCSEQEKLLDIVLADPNVTVSQKRAMRKRVAGDIFWSGGYAESINGDWKMAGLLMKKAMAIYRWDIRMAKTYGLFKLRSATKGNDSRVPRIISFFRW